jgi:hypothetical protein
MAGMQQGKKGSKDPAGMKRAFQTPETPHTRLDEDQPKSEPAKSEGNWFESLGSRINRGAKAAVKKIGG